jgi:hypothetical protein
MTIEGKTYRVVRRALDLARRQAIVEQLSLVPVSRPVLGVLAGEVCLQLWNCRSTVAVEVTRFTVERVSCIGEAVLVHRRDQGHDASPIWEK